jgi:hypothetical protein
MSCGPRTWLQVASSTVGPHLHMQALVTAVLFEKSQKVLPVTPAQSVSERQAPVGMVMLVAPTGLPAVVPSAEQRLTATCGRAGSSQARPGLPH